MMKELIIGTGNAAKKKAIQSVLTPLGITIKGTDDLGIALEIQEDGATAQENARKKSLLYAQAVGRPVLSVDNALYLEGLLPDEQPGIHTRRIPGKTGRATDEDLLKFYARTITALGGRINGHWEYALCLADAQGHVCEQIFSPLASSLASQVLACSQDTRSSLSSLTLKAKNILLRCQRRNRPLSGKKLLGKPLWTLSKRPNVPSASHSQLRRMEHCASFPRGRQLSMRKNCFSPIFRKDLL